MAGSEVKYNNFEELRSLISFLAEHGQLHYDSSCEPRAHTKQNLTLYVHIKNKSQRQLLLGEGNKVSLNSSK